MAAHPAQAGESKLQSLMAKLAANPRFKVQEGTDEALVLGGQSPAHPKPAAGSPAARQRP
jgi:hypothetical protein